MGMKKLPQGKDNASKRGGEHNSKGTNRNVHLLESADSSKKQGSKS